jgi:hypothetical protein
LKNITCNGNRGATVHANAANPPITPVHHKVSRNVPVPSPSAAARATRGNITNTNGTVNWVMPKPTVCAGE